MAYREFKRMDGAKGRLKYSEVKFFIEREIGWKLLSETYLNLKTPLDVVCPMGHKTQIKFENFRNRQECPICEMLNVGENNLVRLNRDINKKSGYRVLGIDQATQASGYSVFEDGILIDYGLFEVSGKDLAGRINKMRVWLINLLELVEPDYVFLEGVQFQNDIPVYEALCKNLGVFENLLYAKEISYEIVPVGTWRSHANLKGSARIELKANARKLVRDKYGQVCGEDEADAILIGAYGVAKRSSFKNEKQQAIFGF